MKMRSHHYRGGAAWRCCRCDSSTGAPASPASVGEWRFGARAYRIVSGWGACSGAISGWSRGGQTSQLLPLFRRQT